MESEVCSLDQLPQYLKDLVGRLTAYDDSPSTGAEVKVLDIDAISQIDSPTTRYAHLLLRRHVLTEVIAKHGLHPPLLHQRALVYEGLGYADLAAADAFITCTLCETVRSEEWISDLEPVEISGEPWPLDDGDNKILKTLCDALAVLCRSLVDLQASEDAREKFNELVDRYGELIEWDGDKNELTLRTTDYVNRTAAHYKQWNQTWDISKTGQNKFGWSRREIYPWNDYEPDRNSSQSLVEINNMLVKAAPDLIAKVTILPALNEEGIPSEGTWHQLGLFAAKELAPDSEILREKSLITAIRPLDDALCDACGVDLESTPRENMRQCPGEDCDTTFCSEDCASRAANEYHRPNLPLETDDDDEADDNDNEDNSEIDPDYPPPHAPFCGNTALHEIGRTTSTTTAEWDLYFLLLTRTLQTSITQSHNPLSLPITKYLWGDFNTPPSPLDPSTTQPKTLPWSLHHNLTLPLQYFETLMHSLPTTVTPYSAAWLANFDWWIQATLLAKFRGVANAQQSTFDGKAEIAAVHPLWCLANHSCEPNVRWTPTGERVFVVRDGGVKEGEEIWSHYTDVRLSVGERRERLMEVLGGVCRCVRCEREAKE